MALVPGRFRLVRSYQRLYGAASILAVMFCLSVQAFAIVSSDVFSTVGVQQPSPSLSPTEVVKIQVAALKVNDASNSGIELTFRFASPENRSTTGPLERFIRMVRSSPYDRLINHRSVAYGPIRISGDDASQEVTVEDMLGEKTTYLWVLGRQDNGKYADCWMTDAVLPLTRPKPRRMAWTLSLPKV